MSGPTLPHRTRPPVLGIVPGFPFPALVGQEQLKTALCVAAVQPSIGGVLVRGEKGTAKSTAARALARLLPAIRVVAGCPFHCDPEAIWPECPHCAEQAVHPAVERPVPFVTLPLGATEDRVLGTLDVARALGEGRRAFEPGLLADAHRGVLYIDEVNLLADHLVDVLLDAAAMGINPVQREGVSLAHPARFTLVGTMNPEEGELRPQFLDRFGLAVEVTSPRDPAARAEVVRRRIAFDADPIAFAAQWEGEESYLADHLRAAQARLSGVGLDDATLNFIARLCSEVHVDGLRADIALHKTARTLAALDGADAVTLAHVRTAAELVLPHRVRRRPFDQPTMDRGRLDEHFAQARLGPPGTPPDGPPRHDTPLGSDVPNAGTSSDNRPNDDGASDGWSPEPPSGSEEPNGPRAGDAPRGGPCPTVAPRAVPRLSVASSAAAPGMLRGRHDAGALGSAGRYVRAMPDDRTTDVAVDATLRAAALRGAGGSIADGGATLQVAREDLHRKVREARTGTLVLFVLDASGSMSARQRVDATRGAILGLLTDAYQRRDRVGLIAFRGPRAEVVIAPTNSAEIARRALDGLPTGGRTPLAHALALAAETIARVRREDPGQIVLLVVVSDGKANVPLPGTTDDPWEQSAALARALERAGIAALVLDDPREFVQTGRAGALASLLGGQYLPVDQFTDQGVLRLIESSRATVGHADGPNSHDDG